jgi:uncharacterized membrane protein
MANATAGEQGQRFSGRLELAGLALGFGLGGFFDGILLHQILQWHHLLSGIEQARLDIRYLILADGLFHLVMYIITGLGLVLLWRARREFGNAGADRRLVADAVLGFGVWHVADSVVSHWVLGLHRVRMDVQNPLAWDLLWFALFGLVPLVAGALLRRKRRGRAQGLMSAPLALLGAVLIAGPASLLPAQGEQTTMVLFRPGMSQAEAFDAIQAVDGRLLWSDPSGQLWAVDLSSGSDPSTLYFYGAMLVSNSIVPAGCLDWVKA